MKLEKILIENFRGIERMELDFQDELGRLQNVVPIVGPNTSGKTTILDAIHLCLGPSTELFAEREDLAMTPSSIVRRGNVRAHVECTVRFSDEEIEKTREILLRIDDPDAANVPMLNQVKVSWDYPDLTEKHPRGINTYDPAHPHAYLLFKGRKRAVRSFYVPGVGARSLQTLGGIFMFDQKRTGLGLRKRKLEDGTQYTQNPREILLDLATRAKAKQASETTQRDDFEHFCELYAKICNPHRIKDLINTEPGLDMEFEGPQGTYLYDGLSSGQVMLLMLLVQFARHRIHNSIVLIDELELHLHPLWQSRLFVHLEDLGVDNQVFFTTHSTHLREALRGTFFHCTGDLGDEPVKKVER